MEELFNKLQREKNLTNLQNLYDEIIKEFILFADADVEKIGKVVIDAFIESEQYYTMG